ncbi:MAG: VanZ family protein [Gammaproteobacteria bacterium]|nr:VanZ family protein [Gammaproteobacteria bacterium]
MPDKNPDLRFKIFWLLIGFGLIAFVVVQSLTPSPVDIGVHFWDKSLHTVGYFGLMGWFMQIYHTRQAKVFWTVFFVMMGVGLEFLQDLGGVRHYEVNDMIANCLGVLIALILSFTLFAKILVYFDRMIASKFS